MWFSNQSIWIFLFEQSHLMITVEHENDTNTYHVTLQWSHNKRDGVSNHHCPDCLLNGLFRSRSKKILKLHFTGLYEGNLPVADGYPSQRASNAENLFIWWRPHNTLPPKNYDHCSRLVVFCCESIYSPGSLSHVGYPFETCLILKSREITLVPHIRFSCPFVSLPCSVANFRTIGQHQNYCQTMLRESWIKDAFWADISYCTGPLDVYSSQINENLMLSISN